MNLSSLRYFVTVAEELNITRAAEKLYMSQQSLSYHINHLEEELNARLFERNPRLSLTYTGICVLRISRQMLDLEKQLYSQIDDINNQHLGRLSVGLTRIRARVMLPKILSAINAQYPNVEIHTMISSKQEITESLLNGELDLIICNRPQEHPALESIDLVSDAFCVIIPKKFMQQKYHEQYKAVATSWLASKSIDYQILQEFPVLLGHKTSNRTDTDLLFSRQHITPQVLMESSDIETLFELCQANMGIMFSYKNYAQHSINHGKAGTPENVYIFPLDAPDLCGNIKICYMKDRYQSRIFHNFIQIAKESAVLQI